MTLLYAPFDQVHTPVAQILSIFSPTLSCNDPLAYAPFVLVHTPVAQILSIVAYLGSDGRRGGAR